MNTQFSQEKMMLDGLSPPFLSGIAPRRVMALSEVDEIHVSLCLSGILSCIGSPFLLTAKKHIKFYG